MTGFANGCSSASSKLHGHEQSALVSEGHGRIYDALHRCVQAIWLAPQSRELADERIHE
jgi:hypothetical protein